jgi:TP901 family phage tail tape measure protein
MVDRSVRVVLNADVAPYVAATNRAAKATRDIAVAAAEVRTKLAAISSGNGLDNLARDLGKVNLALRGMSGARDIALVANAIRTLSGSGAGLTASVNDIRRFATAIRSIPASSAATMREVGTALHGLGSLSTGGAAAEITAMSTGIRRLIRDANSVPAIRALASALRDLGAAGGGLGNLGNVGNSLRGMQGQIDQLRRSIAGLRGAAGGGSGGSSGGLFATIFGSTALANIASQAAMRAFSAIATGLKSTVKATADYETQIQTFGAVTKASADQMKQASALAIKLGGDVTIAGASASDAAGVLTELAKGGLNVSEAFKAAKGSLQLASAAQVDMGTAAGIQTAALNSFNLGADQAGKVADILANTAAAASGEITDFAEGMKQSGAVAHSFGMSLLENQTILAQFAQAGIKGSMGGNILKSAILSVERAAGPSGKALKEMGVEVKKSNGTYISAAEFEDQLANAKKRMGTTAYNTAAAVAFGTRGVIFANVAANNGAKGFDTMSRSISNGAGAAAFSQAKMSGLGGAMKQVQNQFETAQVVIGEKFSGALQTALKGVSAAIPVLTKFLTGGAAGAGVSGISKWFSPLVDGAKALVTTAAPYVSAFIGSLSRGFSSVMTFVKPVADGIGTFFKNLTDNGTVSMFGSALTAIGKGFEGVMKWLAPAGQVVGDFVGWLGKIPGPIYAGAAALGAFLLLRGPLTAMLFKAAWNIGLLRVSLTNLAAGGVMSGIKRIGSGLLGALGGPVGLAITGVTIGLGYLFSAMGNGKQAGEDLKGEIDAITASLNENTGAITDNTRATVADNLQKNGTVTAAKNLGLNLGDLESAALGSSDGMSRLNFGIGASVAKTVAASEQYKEIKGDLDAAGISAADLTKAVQTNDFGSVQAKWSAYGATLTDNVDATLRLNHEQDALNTIISGAPALMAPYADVLSKVGDQSKGVAEGQQTVADKLALTTQAAKDYASGGVSGMELANEAAMISANKAVTAFDGLQEVVDSAKITTSDFYTVVAGKTKNDPSTTITPMTVAFGKYNDAVSAADTTTQLFVFTMDKLAGRNVSVEDAMSANAAAARGLGAAQRGATQNLIDQRKATEDLATARANLNKIDPKSGLKASDATTADDIAAAEMRLADANDKVAGSQDGINQAATEYQKTAALRISQIAATAAKTGGFTGAVKAATAEMGRQRAAFIAQQPAADIASGAAAKLADKYGLIPKNVTTIIKGDPSLAKLAAKDAQHTAELVAIRKYEMKLTADGMPATVTVSNLGKATDLATRLRTLKINGEDNASQKVKDVLAQIALLKDKTVTLAVDATGVAGSMKIASDGSFTTSSGAKGLASGGYVSGPGGPREDKIPAMLSNGEFVVNAAATKKHAPLLHAINRKYADGGLVTTNNVAITGSGNIDVATNRITGILANAEKSAAALNAAAAAQAASMQAASGLLGSNHPDQFGWRSGDVANIVPYSFHGIPFPAGVAKGTTPLWNSLLSALEPTIPGGIRPGENWGYENRDNVNSPGTKSFHSFGLALDVNAPENPNIPGSKGSRGNGPGMIPNSAAALARSHNMLWGGDWGDAMHFELHETPQQVNGGGASSGAPAGVSGPVGSGVERWRSLALKVAAIHHELPDSVNVMLNQMKRESGGDPTAQNNWDDNAKKGTPSKGLLQFIDPTFRSNMDAGYGNIWDPESQMRAWFNYMNNNYGGWAAYSHRNGDVYGAYANGGLVTGPGSGRSDSINARVSNGEYIVNAASTAKNLPLLHSINHYADGGLVGSLTALSGRTAATAGPELSQVVSALQEIAQAVIDARQAVKDKNADALTARGNLNAAKVQQASDVTAAEQRLTAARRAQSEQGAKASAHTKSVNAGLVRNAEEALAKTKAASTATVTKARTEYNAAVKTLNAYVSASAAADKYQASMQRQYHAQQIRAGQIDVLTTRLSTANDKLASLRSDRASMASGIAGTVSGFDGGITGHNDSRTTFDRILKGQQYDQAKIVEFNRNIIKLRKLGLSNDSLQGIASAGVDGGGVTAKALAGASKAQIATLNATTSQITKVGNNVGGVVAGAFYDAGISAGAGLVKGLESQVGAIQKVMNSIATSVVTTLTTKLKIHSPSKVMEGHGVNIVDGLNNGILSGYGKVGSSMAELVQAPNIPASNYSRAAAAPQVTISIGGSDDLSAAVLSMIDVKIDGHTVALTQGLRKARMQNA